MMGELYCLKMGTSMRSEFMERLLQLPYGEGLLVLPNRFLLEQTREENSAVRAVNLEYLPHEILRLSGMFREKLISRRAQTLITEYLLKELTKAGKIHYFSGLVDVEAFSRHLMNFFSELARANVTAEEFTEAVRAWERPSGSGLKDEEIAMLFSAYGAELARRECYDLDGLYKLALAALQEKSCSLPWRELYFSEFYTFDALQLAFLRALAEKCRVGIAINGTLKKDMLYEATEHTVADLLGLGFNLATAEPPAENLVPVGTAQDGQAVFYLAEGVKLQVLEATDGETEMRTAIANIKADLTAGVDAGDILLVVRSLEDYDGLRRLFDEYGVPCRLPKITTLLAEPLADFFTKIFAYALQPANTSVLADLLSHRFAGLVYPWDVDLTDKILADLYFPSGKQLETYLTKQGFLQPGTGIKQLLDAGSALPARATIAEYCAFGRDLLASWQVPLRFGGSYRRGELSEEGLKALLATEEGCRELFDEIELAYAEGGLSKMPVSAARFSALWQEYGLEKKVKLLPGADGGIAVLEAANLQGVKVKNIYLLGLREGVFPLQRSDNWLYGESERSTLAPLGIELKTAVSSTAEDRFFFASIVAAARKKLVLSYYSDDEAGMSSLAEELCSSAAKFLVQGVMTAVPGIASRQSLELFLAAQPLLEEREREWLEQAGGHGYAERCVLDVSRFVEGSVFQGCLLPETRDAMLALRDEQYSAGALELFARCPFRFLLEAVWLAEVRTAAEEDTAPVTEGDLYHTVLLNFFTYYRAVALSTVTEEVLTSKFAEIFTAVSKEWTEKGKLGTGVFQVHELKKMREKLLRLILCERDYQKKLQGAHPRLLPQELEWDFGRKGTERELKVNIDGIDAYFRGRIDRLDSDGEYYFLTDYKRREGPKKRDFNLGLDLQMPLYLWATENLWAQNKQVCLGAGYFSVSSGKRTGGYWQPAATILPWVKKAEKDWTEFITAGRENIFADVRGIRSGRFVTAPRDGCPSYCPAFNICRYALRPVEQEEGETDE